MMSKKYLFIVLAIILVAAGGFFVYKKGYFKKNEPVAPEPAISAWEKLLVFEMKNNNLTQEQKQLFLDRFNETKAELQKNPDAFDRWLYLGVLKKGASDYEGARDVFLYAGEIRPQSSTPFANLADLYAYFLDDPQKAEENIKKAIANDPNDYNFYIALADIYRYKLPGKEYLYEQTMLSAIEKFPDNPNLIAPLAGYYRNTEQIQKAIFYYEKLLKLVPDNQAAKEDLAELRKRK